ALRFEWAYTTVAPAGTIQKRLVSAHCATRPEVLSAGAVVEVACRVILKVAAREGAIVSLRLVVHRNMWRHTLRLGQPVQHRSRAVSGIGRKPLRLETEALLGSLDHGLRCADLGLTNGTGSLNVNDDAELHVDEIIVGVSEERRPLVSSSPLENISARNCDVTWRKTRFTPKRTRPAISTRPACKRWMRGSSRDCRKRLIVG